VDGGLIKRGRGRPRKAAGLIPSDWSFRGVRCIGTNKGQGDDSSDEGLKK